MEHLEDYYRRTSFMWDSLPRYGDFRTADSLTNKVAEDGSFKPFCGDTVIFGLERELKDWLAGVQDRLYALCSPCLAQRLDPESFHITLHDLRSGPGEEMPAGVGEDRIRAERLAEEVKGSCPKELHLRTTCLFSMVNTSVVMGFAPAAEEDCRILMELYDCFQQVVPLNYPLTLHATLAYYKPGEYPEQTLWKLREAMGTIGREELVFPLSVEKLTYSLFRDMSGYTGI